MNLYAIIPCYNEARSLHQSFPLLNGLLQQTSHILHGLLFINDGSSDTTKQELDTLKRQLPSPLKVQNSILDLPTNHGKAGAVFEGMKALKQTKNINDNDLVLLLD
jgi:dolichol-phosphate mannosyltransferase